jgi:uncharacterized protein (TIGR04141 family)
MTQDPNTLLDLLDLDQLGELEQPAAELVQIAGTSGLWVEGTFGGAEHPAEWCADAGRTVGRTIQLSDARSAGLLLLIVDGTTYAISYGQGYRLIPNDVKDHRFGIGFAVRTLDHRGVHALLRRRPGARGRTESTSVPGGLPIWAFDLEDYADLVGRAGGRAPGLRLTHAGDDDRPMAIDGGVGLGMRLGTMPTDLVSDIREVARVFKKAPQPELEFIERIRPVRDEPTVTVLDQQLDELLSRSADEIVGRIFPVVPLDVVDKVTTVSSYSLKIGQVARKVEELTLPNFLDRTKLQRPGQRVAALRDGKVGAYSDEQGRQQVAQASAISWIEATASIGSRRFAIVDGKWYEIDARYLERLRERVAALLAAPSSVNLPTWDRGDTERIYNEHVAFDPDNDFVCLDRKGIKDAFHHGWGFEACDLLGPGNELIHVKHASGSSPLSHLFAQGCVAAQTLENSADARESFVKKVAEVGRGRSVPEDFVPQTVVFAILLKDGEDLTPDTLFPFAQVALIQASKTLQSAATPVKVEVVGIRMSG